MVGTVDVDGLLDSMSPEQLDEWAAYDLVEPIVHSERVLAYIAKTLTAFVGGSLDDEVVMPWMEPEYADPNEIRGKNGNVR